jgi:Zinc finger, C3HC4 type (RING finger)
MGSNGAYPDTTALGAANEQIGRLNDGHSEPLAFSQAMFDDADAGSGNFTSLQPSVSNVLQYHLNAAAAIVPDERDYLRPWRKRLRDMLANETDMMTMFLEKPLEDTSLVQRHSAFIQALSMPTLNLNSEWLKTRVEPQFDSAAVLADLETQIGAPLATIRNHLHKVMDTYLATLEEMFRSVHCLSLKMDKVDALKKKLLDLTLDDTDDTDVVELKQAVLTHVRCEYERNKIQDDYSAFCSSYARFTALRSVLMCLSVSTKTADGPLCSICTTERVCFALVPCGHTFCNGCTQKQRYQCFVCRTTLRDRQRLYFI